MTPNGIQTSALVNRAEVVFRQHFGRASVHQVRAPGRINLIGEHVDYNDGVVLPFAIGLQVVMVAGANGRRVVRIFSNQRSECVEIPLDEPVGKGQPDWGNYIRGVISGFRQGGFAVPGFDAVIESDLPSGAGLSSSAALTVATATLLEALLAEALPPVEKALLCWRAECAFAGLPCGIMDQFACVLGHANQLLLLDCRSRVSTPIPWHGDGLAFLIIDTQVKHNLAHSAYAERRQTCEEAAHGLGVPSLRDWPAERLPEAEKKLSPVAFRRVRHVVTEIARTFAAAEAIQAADWDKLGGLLFASHQSLREDYEVSCPELDEVVRLAEVIGSAGGIIGCRMTGGGFGGAAIALVRTDALDAVKTRLQEDYLRRIPRGLSFIVTTPTDGASRISALESAA